MLDDDHRVAFLGQRPQDAEKLLDVVEVKAGGRLVEKIESPAGRAAGQLAGELDALGLAAGKRRRRLAELDVTQAHFHESPADVRDRGNVGEEVERLFDRKGEDVRDRLSLVVDLKGLAVVALPAAHVARDVDVWQKVHLDLDLPVAAAGLAPAAFDVEGKPSRRVAARPRFGRAGHELADRVEDVRVGRRIRPGRPADR